MRKNSVLLGISIFAISMMLTIGAFIKQPYKVADATMDITGSYLTTSTINNIKGLQGTEIYLASSDKIEGVGINATNWRTMNDKSKLSRFVITNIDEDNNIYLYSEDTGNYLNNNTSSYMIFDENTSTPVPVRLEEDTNRVYRLKNDKKYYIGYSGQLGQHEDIVYSYGYYYMYVVPTSEMSPTNQFGYALLNNLSCDNGVTPPSKDEWSDLKSLYTSLSLGESLKDISSDKDSPVTIKKALAKYDYILSKYGDTNYENFLNRTITPLPSELLNVISDNNDDGVVIITTSIGLISLLSVSIYLFKRKENN